MDNQSANENQLKNGPPIELNFPLETLLDASFNVVRIQHKVGEIIYSINCSGFDKMFHPEFLENLRAITDNWEYQRNFTEGLNPVDPITSWEIKPTKEKTNA